MKLDFGNTMNVSVQPTDIVYAVRMEEERGIGGSNNVYNAQKPKSIGEVVTVNHNEGYIIIDQTGYGAAKSSVCENCYYLFSKNRNANISGILGYYAEVEYKNNSKKASEIFAVGTEYAPSSK